MFSDDGKCVHDPVLMRRALEYVKAFDGVIAQHAQEPRLTEGAQMHEGVVSAELGLPGWPAVAEEAIIARDVLLAEHVGSRLHVCHLSTAGSVEIIRWAKSRGIDVTAEVTPHHLILTDELARGYDPVFKVNPPLRTQRDVEAVREGLADGTIDIVATDHAPHTREDKDCEWGAAAFGMTGLETALSVVQETMVDTGRLTWADVARVMSTTPAQIGRVSDHGRPDRGGGAGQPRARRPGHPARRRARGAGHEERELAVPRPRAVGLRHRDLAARPGHGDGRLGVRRVGGGELVRHATLAVIILIGMVVVALVVMRTGWTARARRTAEFVPALPVAPAELGRSLFGPVPMIYVSTTRAGDWLERITANGLGTRSRAEVEVFDAGVRMLRTGAVDLFVPTTALRDVTVTPGIAGKVVGRDGIVVLTWAGHPRRPPRRGHRAAPAARRRPRAPRRRDRPAHPSDPGAVVPRAGGELMTDRMTDAAASSRTAGPSRAARTARRARRSARSSSTPA